jgi:hypothetical protein
MKNFISIGRMAFVWRVPAHCMLLLESDVVHNTVLDDAAFAREMQLQCVTIPNTAIPTIK